MAWFSGFKADAKFDLWKAAQRDVERCYDVVAERERELAKAQADLTAADIYARAVYAEWQHDI